MNEFTIGGLSYILRPATAEDTAATSALLSASYAALMPSAYSPEVLSAALPMMNSANPDLMSCGTYYVIESVSCDGMLVACGGWTKYRPGRDRLVTDGVGHIRHFATHPDWIGKGLAKKLIGKCIIDASLCGISRLECFSSLNAEGFYASAGFEALERTAVPMGDQLFPCTLMVCVLPSSTGVSCGNDNHTQS